MPKVAVCNNCKYEDWWQCKKHPVKYSYMKGKMEYDYCGRFNEKGECKDYKKKWWKFWVKEEEKCN